MSTRLRETVKQRTRRADSNALVPKDESIRMISSVGKTAKNFEGAAWALGGATSARSFVILSLPKALVRIRVELLFGCPCTMVVEERVPLCTVLSNM